VTSLDALSRDNLQFLKEKAMKTVFDLLVAKPEQEAKLLASLVNKVGCAFV
jgi:ribosome biogenesis protein MAK21